MPNLRAGIIGLGMMGANHARVLSNLEGVDLVAVVDPQGDAIKVLPKFNVLKSIEELIEIGVDYCIISAPTSFHEQIALNLIDKRIHFLVEKPIADSYISAQRICSAAKFANVIGAVGHIERFNSALQEARKRVLAGELGVIHQVATSRQGPFPARISDVGVVKDLATHDIDLTSWLTGKKYLHVSANASFRSGRQFEDLIAVSGMLENSIVVSHLVNWLSPVKERKIVITGERGTFVVDTLRANLIYYEAGIVNISQLDQTNLYEMTQGEVRILDFEKPEPLHVEHKNFRDAVLGKDSNIVTLDEGAITVKIAEAIIESYSTKSQIML